MKLSTRISIAFWLVMASSFAQQQATQRRGGSEGDGSRQFGEKCLICHGNAASPDAPTPATLRSMTPEHIYQTLTTGVMKDIAKDVSDADKRAIAVWVGGRRLMEGQSGDRSAMTNPCSSNPPILNLTSSPAWTGWGVDVANTRFQPRKAGGLSPAQVYRLKLKWAFGLPGATAAYSQPTIADGRLFIGSDSGYVYSLDAATGCVHWSFQAAAGIKAAIVVGPLKAGASKFAAFFGDIHSAVYAVDASSGELLWKAKADDQPLARTVASVVLHEGRLYVPITSLEESEAGGANYVCCVFRGAVAAMNAETGKQLWKTYMIAETPKVIGKTSAGKDIMGPSGAGVWNTPTLDPKRRAVYVTTGNAFTGPATPTSDAVMALSMDTGKVLWTMQATANDIWHGGCGRGPGGGRVARNPGVPAAQMESCAEDGGPDADFSGGVILATLADGRNILVGGQKPGIVWGLDPDRKGAVLWKEDVNRTNANSGIIFGGAADDQNAYFNLKSGGLVAVQLATGLEKWYVPLPPESSAKIGATAAVTATPGVIFSAALDGSLRAFTALDGRPLWSFNTAQEFKTVNGIAAKGGSIGNIGASIAQGMVFVGSGYTGFQGGTPGNVLLAFEPTPITPPFYDTPGSGPGGAPRRAP